MNFLTPAQCRAARALLNWSQPDLSKRCGVHVQTISNFEHEKGSPTKNTLKIIMDALEREGVLFLEDGLIRRSTSIYEIQGENWWLSVLNDVYQTFIDIEGAEVLLFCADDKKSPPEVNQMWKKIRDSGVRMRQLVQEGNKYLIGPPDEYRWIPKKYFENHVTMVYGDKVCLCAENNTKAVVFRDCLQAKTMRNIFNLLWDKLEKPNESIAPDRF